MLTAYAVGSTGHVELFAIELFAKGPGYAKKVAGVAPRTRVIAVSRADMLSQMIHAARRGSRLARVKETAELPDVSKTCHFSPRPHLERLEYVMA